MIAPLLDRLCRREDLTRLESAAMVGEIMEGRATPAQIAALAIALRVKGETAEELAGGAEAMRARMVRVRAPAGAMDVCGTGGDGRGTFNLSTAVAFVVAACGVPVAKHGNRAVSSRAGSADVLEALGARLGSAEGGAAEEAERLLAEVGIAFLFAPAHHGALRHAAPVRRELGVRTFFNLLGPMANPAAVEYQLVGVYDPRWVEAVAAALGLLGARRVLVVHGQGLDEIAPAGATVAARWDAQSGRVERLSLAPADFGVDEAPIEGLAGGDAAANAAILRAALEGRTGGAVRAAIVINAGAALQVAGRAASFRDGAARAARALEDGSAAARLEAFVAATRRGAGA